MICLETSFLVRYFRGEEWAESYLGTIDVDDRALVSTITLYELFAGAIRSPHENVADTREGLLGTEVASLSEAAATEAAEINAELLERGETIPAPDTLIAGTARNAGAELIAIDSHFERVPGLDVYDPREEFAG